MNEPIILIPCPFCGSTKVIAENINNDGKTHVVKCLQCGANTGAYFQGDSLRNAVDAWNRRANDDISFWEEFQHMLYDSTNAQAEAAILILQEKLVKNNDAASCDHLNANRIWVSRDVYDRIRNYPGPVIFDSVGVKPILVSQYPPKKAHK